MKLANSGQGTVRLSIDQIREGANVRTEYSGIEELAESIKSKGQIAPVIVAPAGEEGGVPVYDLISGHRRFRAFRLLCEQGEDFRMIEAKVKSCDREIIQLVENIQRENIAPKDLAEGIKAMLARGMSKSEVARELNKGLTFVTDAVAGAGVIESAAAAGVAAGNMPLRAAAQLRTLPKEQRAAALREALRRGGTVKAAEAVRKEFVGGAKKTSAREEKEPREKAVENPLLEKLFFVVSAIFDDYERKLRQKFPGEKALPSVFSPFTAAAELKNLVLAAIKNMGEERDDEKN
jgi:ParB family chromosome partitioning protein